MLRLLERWRCKLDAATPWKLALCIFLVAFLLRSGMVLALEKYRIIESPEPVQVAETLARTNVFGNPFAGETGPTAFLAPGHPFVLSLMYRVFGFGPKAELVKELFSGAMSALQYGMLPLLAAELGLPLAAGAIAGACGAVFPLFFWIETKGTWELPESMALLLVALCLSAALIRKSRTSASPMFGMVWGVAFLFAPSFVSVFCGILALWLWRIRPKFWRPLLTALVPLLLVVAPWILRNYAELGSIFWIRDNMGYNFGLSNSPVASPLFDVNSRAEWFWRTNPFLSPVERAKVKSLGEIAYLDGRYAEGKAWVRTHPVEFLRLTLQRIWFFWFPPLNHPLKSIFNGAVVIAGFFGLLFMVRRHAYAAAILGLLWAVYPLPYYLVEVDPRYRYPLHVFSLLASACLLIWVLDWLLRTVRGQSCRCETEGAAMERP